MSGHREGWGNPRPWPRSTQSNGLHRGECHLCAGDTYDEKPLGLLNRVEQLVISILPYEQRTDATEENSHHLRGFNSSMVQWF